MFTSPAARRRVGRSSPPQNNRPDIEISFKDSNPSQRFITVTHHAPSGTSKVTLDASTDSDTKVNCGDLQ